MPMTRNLTTAIAALLLLFSFSACGPSRSGSGATEAVEPSSPPNGLSCVVLGPGTVQLRWRDRSREEQGFEILRSRCAGGHFEVIGRTPSDHVQFVDADAPAHETTYYRVRGVRDDTAKSGTSSARTSEVVGVFIPGDTASRPTDVYACCEGSDAIALRWVDRSTDEKGFEIERLSPASKAFVKVGTVAADVTEFRDTSVRAGTTYTYRICALNRGRSRSREVAAATNLTAADATVPRQVSLASRTAR